MSIFKKFKDILGGQAEQAPLATAAAPAKEREQLKLLAPTLGELIAITESPDPVFAQKMVGDGVAINPTDSVVVAPCDGVISQLQEAKHAVAIRHASGAEL